MRFNGQLEEAQLENLSSDPANTPDGRTWLNTTTGKIKSVIAAAVKILVTEDGTHTLTNKTIDADGTGNSITNIENADIKAGAAIAVNKLAALTASRAVVTDGSGFASAATTTSTEIGYVNGVTSAIQTQLDAKQARSTLTTKGDLYVATASATVARQAVGLDGQVLTADSGETNGVSWQTPSAVVVPNTFAGRLTLTSTVPVTTSDVTAATTIYLTPHIGNQIALYNGSLWTYHTLTEISAAVPATTNTNYDVFVYDNTGTLTLDLVAWTNATTRATAIVRIDGVYVKDGATSRRYVGSFRTTTVSGQTADSLAQRFVWNYHNRVNRAMKVIEATDSWNYSTALYRYANNSAANRLDFILGVAEDEVSATASSTTINSGTTGRVIFTGIGLDQTGATDAQINGIAVVTNTHYDSVNAHYRGQPSAGFHYLAWLEAGDGNDTQTWTGDGGQAFPVNGIVGEIRN